MYSKMTDYLDTRQIPHGVIEKIVASVLYDDLPDSYKDDKVLGLEYKQSPWTNMIAVVGVRDKLLRERRKIPVIDRKWVQEHPPIVAATRSGPPNKQVLKVLCPWCGNIHTHGGGNGIGDGDGHRSSHCGSVIEDGNIFPPDPNPGYILKEVT